MTNLIQLSINFQEEIWRDISGFEGLYMISNLGRVKSLERMVHRRFGLPYIKHESILSSKRITYGYPLVNLCKNGEHKVSCVHILVGISFIPNPNNFPVMNHIDGDKLNNKISNLEWCTVAHNIQHAYKTGLKKTIKIKQYDMNGNLIQIHNSVADAKRKGFNANIWKVLNGERKHHKSFVWKYA